MSRTESDGLIKDVNKQFNLLDINIQEGYLDKNNPKKDDTHALDELLGVSEKEKDKEGLMAIDELLNSHT